MVTIFVTVGTQLPFDRLLNIVDRWSDKKPDIKLIVQSCSTSKKFKNFDVKPFLSPKEYAEAVDCCDVLVGHAGMGTIITAHEKNVPLVIMPRLYSLGEHRNDHQLSTVRKFECTPGVNVVNDEKEFIECMRSPESLIACSSASSDERVGLLNYIKYDFLGG